MFLQKENVKNTSMKKMKHFLRNLGWQKQRSNINIGEFELQIVIVKEWTEETERKLVNRLESNSIKKINLIGFQTSPQYS